ncbi:hypothetical protein [Nocardia sp. NPDC052566]|uniref:hypothetical protein n=1 Tax=Nocardia sp. NPDC052566 TaxID=3364330 RepID=UPI0037C6BBCC
MADAGPQGNPGDGNDPVWKPLSAARIRPGSPTNARSSIPADSRTGLDTIGLELTAISLLAADERAAHLVRADPHHCTVAATATCAAPC